jgi:hypothetical protein
MNEMMFEDALYILQFVTEELKSLRKFRPKMIIPFSSRYCGGNLVLSAWNYSHGFEISERLPPGKINRES